jgi:hypothetical protein
MTANPGLRPLWASWVYDPIKVRGIDTYKGKLVRRVGLALLTASLALTWLLPVPTLAARALLTAGIVCLIAGSRFWTAAILVRIWDYEKRNRKPEPPGDVVSELEQIGNDVRGAGDRGPIIVLAFKGVVKEGSAGNAAVKAMARDLVSGLDGAAADGAVIDLTTLAYLRGDAIGELAIPLLQRRVPTAIVATGRTAEALRPLLEPNFALGAAGVKMVSTRKEALALIQRALRVIAVTGEYDGKTELWTEARLETFLHMLGVFAHESIGLFNFFDNREGERYDAGVYGVGRNFLEGLSRFVQEGHFDRSISLSDLAIGNFSPSETSPASDQTTIEGPPQLPSYHQPSEPLFPVEFGRRLAQHEYTRWAADLSQGDWKFLITLQSAVCQRAKCLDGFCREHGEEFDVRGLSQGSKALEYVLFGTIRGVYLDDDEARRRVAGEP